MATGVHLSGPVRLVVELPMAITLAVIQWSCSSHPAPPLMQVPMEHSRVVHRNCRRTSRRLEVQMGSASDRGPGSC